MTHGGQPLLREELDLGTDQRSAFAILDTRRCLDTLTLLGTRLDDGPPVLQLAGPGSIARAITHHVHESTLDQLAAQRPLAKSPSGATVTR